MYLSMGEVRDFEIGGDLKKTVLLPIRRILLRCSHVGAGESSEELCVMWLDFWEATVSPRSALLGAFAELATKDYEFQQ